MSIKRYKLLIPIVSVLLIASCGKSDGDLVLLCDGRLHANEYNADGDKRGKETSDTIVENYKRTYEFKNKKYGERYKCDWTEETIVCRAKTENGKVKNDNYFKIDRLRGEISTLDEMWAKDAASDKFNVELGYKDKYWVEDYKATCIKSDGKKF